MNAVDALKIVISSSEHVCLGYLNDLTDAEMMLRPHPGCNHINWQIGHLVLSEHEMLEAILPGSMPALPAGFAMKYRKEAAGSDDPSAFLTRDKLLQAYREQRTAALALLDQQTSETLDRPSGLEYAPNVGAVFSMLGLHWMMHSGQWVVVRRQTGRAPLF